MKRLVLILMVLARTVAAQSEFPVHANGLIYDDPTMKRLGVIVDSLNVRFRKCALAHPYQSYEQGPALWVEITSADVRKAIRENASPDRVRQLVDSSHSEACWVVRYPDTYGSRHVIVFRALSSAYSPKEIAVKATRKNNRSAGWVMDDEGTEAFWLEGLSSTTLPEKYGRLVQYVDCMVDTTTDIYYDGATYESYKQRNDKAAEFIAMADVVYGAERKPVYDEKLATAFGADSAYAIFHKEYKRWDSIRLFSLDRLMEKSSYHQDLLREAFEEAFDNKTSSAELEYYVARYLSPSAALKLLRSRRVMGRCSMDSRPRQHAIDICMLSAETAQWDVFLRSHLNVMNDRFNRMSDGSYAQPGRKTYLKELEVLDIDAPDLLLGTCFRVTNVSGRHYFGTIARIGRALTDTENKDAVEATLLAMIADPQLDRFNRMIMANTLITYLNELGDCPRKAACSERLSAEIAKMDPTMRAILK